MRSRTSLLAVLFLVPLGLNGCSSDSDDAAPQPVDSLETPTEAPKTDARCRADVRLGAGDIKKWSAPGSVRLKDGAAVYTVSRGNTTVTLYSADESGGASAAVVTAKSSYATLANGPDGLEVKPNGKSARADEVVVPSSGSNDQVLLSATFDCRV